MRARRHASAQFSAYAAALAGYTAAIIANDQLGAVGGLNGQAFLLAVTRASRFTGTLATAGAEFESTQTIRRELIRRVVALDPVIDEAFGEASRLRYHSPVLQRAVDGLLAALAGWRAVAVLLARSPQERARQEAGTVFARLPSELRFGPEQDQATRWMADPTGLLRVCDVAVRRLVALPAGTPSLRLLADQTAEVLAAISHALNGLALLVADPARPVSPSRGLRRLRIPDWLPSLVNAGRAFVVIGAAELFWIVTEWPNGAGAITFATIGVLLFAPRADYSYTAAFGFAVGTMIAAVAAAIIEFAVLPNLETFAAFSLAIGLWLGPAGAAATRPWQGVRLTYMAAYFPALLAPTNQMSYDTQQFYNAALAIVAGSGAAALSFRLIPPLSPAFRTRRLLVLTLRDLHRLSRGPIPRTSEDWEGRMYGRLSALPDVAQPLQRAEMLAAFSVGTEIIQLRRIAHRMDLGFELDRALEMLRRGDIGLATTHLDRLDGALADRPGAAALRGSILALSEVLTQHPTYFEAGERG